MREAGAAGLVAIDGNGKWVGGRYYLQHLVMANQALAPAERMPLVDVWWKEMPAEDPFEEVRDLLPEPIVLRYPESGAGRALRYLRRRWNGWRDARDLFLDAAIDVVFPVLPCANPGVPFVFWLPDFQYRRLPELFDDAMRRWYDDYYAENVEAARLVVLSSRDAAHDFDAAFPRFASKARVLSFASAPLPGWWERDPATTAAARGLPDRFFVMANQFSSHKNHGVVFEAVRILRDRGVPVVVACTGSPYSFRGEEYPRELAEFRQRHRLEASLPLLGLLPRGEQVAILRKSIAVLQPSRFEGWSTVVEDAKTLGKPILVSDLAVHREQLGEEHGYLPLDDADAWAAAIEAAWRALPAGPGADEGESVARTRERQRSVGERFVAILREARG